MDFAGIDSLQYRRVLDVGGISKAMRRSKVDCADMSVYGASNAVGPMGQKWKAACSRSIATKRLQEKFIIAGDYTSFRYLQKESPLLK
jgi:hypothetical protein